MNACGLYPESGSSFNFPFIFLPLSYVIVKVNTCTNDFVSFFLFFFFIKEASSHDLISAGRKPIGNDLQWEIEGRLQRCSVDDSWIQSTMLVKKFLRRNNLPTSPGLFQFLSIYHRKVQSVCSEKLSHCPTVSNQVL